MTGWIEEEEKIALGGTVMRLEQWSRPKRKCFFIFNILCDRMESRHKTLLRHKEEKQLFDLQAELAAVFTEQHFLLERAADRFWHLAGIFSKEDPNDSVTSKENN